jgi:hypothetical protein
MDHELYEVFKGTDGKWKLQMPKGLLTYRTKKAAESMAAACIEADEERVR